jgi:hypothetical protein
MIDFLLYGLLALWIAGAAVILWATLTTSEGGYDNIPIALSMAIFWPLWVVLGIASAFIEIRRINRNRVEKPIDKQDF